MRRQPNLLLAISNIAVILCFTAGCYMGDDDYIYTDTPRSAAEVKAKSLIDNKWYLEENDQLLTEEEKKLINEWEAYLGIEFQFASSLNDEQLDAFGKLMSAFYTSPSDTATRIKASRKIEEVLPSEKLEELIELVRKRDDIAKRWANLQNSKESHYRQIAPHNEQIQKTLGTLASERQRAEMQMMHNEQNTQIISTWLQEQQRQRESGVYIIP